MALPFCKFLLDALNSEQKPSVKKRYTKPVRYRSTGRSTGVDFEIYRSGQENSDRFHVWFTVSITTTLDGAYIETKIIL